MQKKEIGTSVTREKEKKEAPTAWATSVVDARTWKRHRCWDEEHDCCQDEERTDAAGMRSAAVTRLRLWWTGGCQWVKVGSGVGWGECVMIQE